MTQNELKQLKPEILEAAMSLIGIAINPSENERMAKKELAFIEAVFSAEADLGLSSKKTIEQGYGIALAHFLTAIYEKESVLTDDKRTDLINNWMDGAEKLLGKLNQAQKAEFYKPLRSDELSTSGPKAVAFNRMRFFNGVGGKSKLYDLMAEIKSEMPKGWLEKNSYPTVSELWNETNEALATECIRYFRNRFELLNPKASKQENLKFIAGCVINSLGQDELKEAQKWIDLILKSFDSNDSQALL